MDLTWSVDRDAGVSLVRCRVHNDGAVRRRVRIESRFDGPVLPPRQAGVPEAGWDSAGVTLDLAAGERRALGFAVVAPPVEPPVELTETTTIDGCDDDESPHRDETAAAVLRELADHRPPRAAVESGVDADVEQTERTGTVAGTGRVDHTGADADAGRTNRTAARAGDRQRESTPSQPSSSSDSVDTWLDAVEKRVERAERLTDADLATATAAVDSAGGLDAVQALDDRVAVDAERLREVSERASSLAARAEASDAPIEALERLA